MLSMLIPNAGVFATAYNGKNHGELYGGLIIRPFPGVNEGALRGFNLELQIGGGLGGGGIPIVGGGARFEAEVGVMVSDTIYYHYVNGWWNEFACRVRVFPGRESPVEGWFGILGRIAGKWEDLPRSLEAGPIAAVVFRWPTEGIFWVTWPLRRLENRTELRLRAGIEFQF
ncbi:MAG: hypothetical protein AAB408_01445 [Patescibacteria group bacterium]